MKVFAAKTTIHDVAGCVMSNNRDSLCLSMRFQGKIKAQAGENG